MSKKSQPAWPADQVERRPVADLVPYARNARTHSPQQVDQIAASIREWGWTSPVLVGEDNSIIAGHGRVLAAQKLKLADVPVMVARGWTDAQRRAYVLADNKLALNSGWDDGLLRLEIADLSDSGFALDLLGFDPGEIDNVLNGWSPDMAQIDRVEPEMSALESVIKVRCKSDDAQRVKQVLEDALRESGVEGASVAG